MNNFEQDQYGQSGDQFPPQNEYQNYDEYGNMYPPEMDQVQFLYTFHNRKECIFCNV